MDANGWMLGEGWRQGLWSCTPLSYGGCVSGAALNQLSDCSTERRTRTVVPQAAGSKHHRNILKRTHTIDNQMIQLPHRSF